MGFQLPTSTGDLRISEPIQPWRAPNFHCGKHPKDRFTECPLAKCRTKKGWMGFNVPDGRDFLEKMVPLVTGVVSLGENVSKMCFSLNVFHKICKIFSCCNKNPARICLGEWARWFSNSIPTYLGHRIPEISDGLLHKSRKPYRTRMSPHKRGSEQKTR